MMEKKTRHKIQAVYLEILFLQHAGQARERKQEANLEG